MCYCCHFYCTVVADCLYFSKKGNLDGRYRIDNNLAEKAIRPKALGRKDWLFCGNDEATENSAIMYSMFGWCKASEVNFREWLVYFLNNVHYYDLDYSKDLAELLPHNFNKKSRVVSEN